MGGCRKTKSELRAEVKRLLEQAEKVDAEEDARYGRDRRGDELPAELARRETRLEKIREAKRALEERAREQAKSKGKSEEEVKPEAKMQYNFTDPESRIMKGSDSFAGLQRADLRDCQSDLDERPAFDPFLSCPGLARGQRRP
jgi:hypothetical protein